MADLSVAFSNDEEEEGINSLLTVTPENSTDMSVSFEDTKEETIGNVLKPSVVEDTTVDVAENIQPVNVQTDKLLSKQTDVDDTVTNNEVSENYEEILDTRDSRVNSAYEKA